MTSDKVQAKIIVKSDNFDQVLEESVVNSSSSYDDLIAANEQLRAGISKIFTEYVNKARLEQETNGNGEKKKRKLKQDDDQEENEDEEDNEEDIESSDNNEDEE